MSTYTPIASITLSNAQSSVTFSEIPQTYTNLILVCNVQLSSSGQSMLYQFNGDTATNYSLTILKGNGTSATSTRRSNINYQLAAGWDAGLPTSSSFATGIVNIQNYSNATTNKTSIARGSNAAGGDVTATVNLWRNTAAITSITVYTGVGNLASGSTFNLYGVVTSGITVAKATGGDLITRDTNYWYHTFFTSGKFTPSQSITADYLVIAGGGGGGTARAGGGGAGGFRTSIGGSSLSLTAQEYPVTIGAGGAATAQGSDSVFASITSVGGGYGGDLSIHYPNGGNGGSGGGGAGDSPSGGAGGTATSGQGNNGGAGRWDNANSRAGGGGGGAGGAGSNGSSSTSSTGGNGGAGLASSLSGVSVTYAGGGGGGVGPGAAVPGSGGSGGGGAGSNGDGGIGEAGRTNSGSGGGGGGGTGGAGGSGIVIVRYAV